MSQDQLLHNTYDDLETIREQLEGMEDQTHRTTVASDTACRLSQRLNALASRVENLHAEHGSKDETTLFQALTALMRDSRELAHDATLLKQLLKSPLSERPFGPGIANN